MEEDGFNGDNDPAALLEVVVLLDEDNLKMALDDPSTWRDRGAQCI